jgi:hypothetical protein
MILWARYTGNTVDGNSLDGDIGDAIDTDISNFLDRELPGLRIPYTHPESGSDPPLKVLLVQKKTDFVLWSFRQVITSLQYDDKYAAHFSDLAVSTTDRMAAFAQDARRPFSLRHHMISSLSGSLLVLCSLLVREPTYDRQAEVEAFRNTLAMLKDLAFCQPYAKRVLNDFEAIIRVVEGAIAGKEVPNNVAELMPYKSPSSLIRLPKVNSSAQNTSAGTHASESGYGILWL